MKFSKHITASLMTAALAASMTCALPAMASAAPTATNTEATATYTAMATSTVKKKTMKANEKHELDFKLNGKKIKSTKVAWKSGNKKIATVSKKGFVTTKKEGKVTLTGKYQGHTIYYKLTVKGDAAFDAVVDAMKEAIKADKNVQHITENGSDIYRVVHSDDETDNKNDVEIAIDYDAIAKQFAIAIEANQSDSTYKLSLSFSEKYANKTCALVSAKDGKQVNKVDMAKSKFKSTENYDMGKGNYLDNVVFYTIQIMAVQAAINSDSGEDVLAMCHLLGFTSIDK